MKIFFGAVFILALLQCAQVQAAICEDREGVAGEIITSVSVCDVQVAFDNKDFPRSYSLLNRGLQNPLQREDVLESALSIANSFYRAKEFARVEKIYQIVLQHFPALRPCGTSVLL